MRIICLILCWLPMASVAEDKASRTCRILFLKAHEGGPDAMHLFDGTQCQEVDLPRMNLSKIYQIAPGEVILRLLPAPVEAQEQIDPAAPGVKIAAGISDCYLLVTSDPANRVAPIRLAVINAGKDRFKNGQMLWYNLSEKTVGGVLGRRRLSLKPGAHAILEAPADTRGDYKVDLAFMIEGDEKIHPLCETKWRHDPRSRTVLFIVDERGRRAPRVLGFPDRRPAEVTLPE